MNRYIQNRPELLDHMREQIGLMKRSANSYDAGFESEAKNLAIRMRVLLYDTKASVSLLTHLNKSNITFYDSATPYRPNNILPYNGLTMIRVSGEEARFVPPLDGGAPTRSTSRKISYNTWWKGVFILRDAKGETFTRSKLVIEVADTDGGAHIDLKLKEEYANLSRLNSLGWKYCVNSPVLPSIRQIAHEVLKTLNDEFPELF